MQTKASMGFSQPFSHEAVLQRAGIPITLQKGSVCVIVCSQNATIAIKCNIVAFASTSPFCNRPSPKQLDIALASRTNVPNRLISAHKNSVKY
jgi:hypothetical protein